MHFQHNYNYAHGKAYNCLEIGLDLEKIPLRKADDWIANVTKCLYAFLAKYLKRNGILYLALPNGMNYRKQQKGFRTSFLRDAHLSYFSRMNIMKMMEMQQKCKEKCKIALLEPEAGNVTVASAFYQVF